MYKGQLNFFTKMFLKGQGLNNPSHTQDLLVLNIEGKVGVKRSSATKAMNLDEVITVALSFGK